MHRAEDASDQVVVVGQVLASEVNIGFEGIVNTSVLRINDKPVTNLRQVCLTSEQQAIICTSYFLRMSETLDPGHADVRQPVISSPYLCFNQRQHFLLLHQMSFALLKSFSIS